MEKQENHTILTAVGESCLRPHAVQPFEGLTI